MSETTYQLFESVRAGVPFTPAEEPSDTIQIERFLIEHPNCTFLVKVKGDSMKDAGIMDGDIAIVDKSLRPKNYDIVIASLSGDVTIKYYSKERTGILLLPANEAYSPIVPDTDTEIL